MEAGRAMMRGFVTDKTTLIASSHRVYAVSEKIKLGDGRQNPDEIIAAGRETAAKFILADMDAAGREAGAVISAVMFGALAGSGALPIERKAFEDLIRAGGRSVDENLKGFAKGFDHGAATSAREEPASKNKTAGKRQVSKAAGGLLARMQSELPPASLYVATEGLKKTDRLSGRPLRPSLS